MPIPLCDKSRPTRLGTQITPPHGRASSLPGFKAAALATGEHILSTLSHSLPPAP